MKTNVRHTGRSSQRFSLNCLGHETALEQCVRYTFNHGCYWYSQVKIACQEHPDFIRFMSGISEKQSIINHTIMYNMSGIHVTGAPPIFTNVKIVNSEDGIRFLGSGLANEKDVTLKKLKLESVCTIFYV